MRSFVVALFLAVGAVVMADKDNDTNETEVIVSPTEAPTEAPSEAPTPAPELTTTTFSFALGLGSLDDFDATETMGGVAAALGVDAANVVIQTHFVLSTVMTFASAVTSGTLDSAKTTLAAATGLSGDAVEYTFSGRRLGSHEGKKVDFSITVPTNQKDAARGVENVLSDPNTVAPVLGLAPSDLQMDPVKIHVAVSATVSSATAVEAPTAEALLDAMKAVAPSKTFVVSVEGGDEATNNKATAAPTTAPTAAPEKEEEEEEDAAFSAPVPLALTLTVAMAMNMAVF